MKAVAKQKPTGIEQSCQIKFSEQLLAGKSLDVQWDGDGRMTSRGGMAYFAEFLRSSAFLDPLLRGSPLRYTSPNAPEKASVMGSLLVAVLDGIGRYAGIDTLRRDAVTPELLGFERMVSEDSVRNGLKQISERSQEWDSWITELEDRIVRPLLCEAYIADLDNTVKSLYGHQEGAEKSYNPKKPGRPSHNYQTWAMGATRIILGVNVLPGKKHSGKYGAAATLGWIDRLPPQCRPRLLRGDVGYGSNEIMESAEARNLPYVFKLSRTKSMKRRFESLCHHEGWISAMDGWEGLFKEVCLPGWSRSRRCLFLRRPAEQKEKKKKKEQQEQKYDQLLLPNFYDCIETQDPMRKWDFCVLASNETTLSEPALAQLYRDRGDCENIFDELKNQWGWGGFVTHDMARTSFMARFVALVYNLWSVFTRLVSPNVHLEATTSRALLFRVMARMTTSGRKTILHLVSNHAKALQISAALNSIHLFVRRLEATAPQLDANAKWAVILRAAFRAFWNEKPQNPPPRISERMLLSLPIASV